MILWIPKKELNALRKVDKTLKGLIEQQEMCQDNQARLRRDMDNVDLDMSALYDKVSHALSRLGGRKGSRGKVEEPQPQIDINEQIRQGVFDGGQRSN